MVKTISPTFAAKLASYLAPFASYFKRSEGRQSLERHLVGLLADLDCKNGEQIAQAVPGTNSQRLQALLTELQWDANAVNEQRVQQLIREATFAEGVLICGETAMPKQGAASVGVARQYARALGKMMNCQVVISWQYADAYFSWPVNLRLYLPANWTQDAVRCQRAHIPREMQTYMTKPEIALLLLDEADRWGVPYGAIAADCTDGSDPTLLAGLESRGKQYVVAVPGEFGVRVSRRSVPTVERAVSVLTHLPEHAWQTWPQGGGARKKWARVRCWRAAAAGRGTYGWLLGERPVRGQRQEEWKCYFSNAGSQATLQQLVRVARQNSHLEEFYQEAKRELGWDHYEGRLWHGFHRHALLVCLAHSFLVLLRARQRYEGSSSQPVSLA
jgi:SRSO17 transposase